MEKYQSDFAANKGSRKYILEYSKNLWRDADRGVRTYNFSERKDRMILNRKYSEGLNSIDKFKPQFSQTGDYSMLNMDWAVSTPLPKFSEIVRSIMLNQPFNLNFVPIDRLSLTQTEKERNLIYAKMQVKRMLGGLEQEGVDLGVTRDLPKNEDEYEIFVNSNFKTAQTIALETITKAILEDNDIEAINKKIAKDLVDNKIAGVRITIDENKYPKVRYVDPERLVTSFVKKDDFSDAKHIGEIIDVTFEDLRVAADGQFSYDEFLDIAKNVAGRYGNNSWRYGEGNYYNRGINLSEFDSWCVRVLDYEFFATDECWWQKMEAKNGGFYFQKKPEGYEPPKNPKRKREIVKRRIKNVYCAKYIVGTDLIYDYGKREHIIRKRLNGKYSTNTTLGFVVYAPDIYDMENKSLVEQMIPYADEMIRIQLKMQQFVSKAKPPGLMMDIDAVVGALQGMGMGGMKPLDARAITDQIGDIYFKSSRQDGTPIQNSRPIERSPSGLDEGIQILTGMYNAALARMKETIGFNDAVDGSQPHKDSLVGVQKLAVMAHNNAMKTLYSGFLYINQEVARQVCLLTQQLIKNGYNIESFKNLVGEDVLREIDFNKLGLADYAINVKMLPDEEDKLHIEKLIELGISRDTMTVEDAIEVREVLKEDVQKAAKLLAIRERIRAEQKAQQAQQNSMVQAEVQAQAAQLSEQAKQQTIQVEKQLEMERLKLEYELKKELEVLKEKENRITKTLEAEFELEKVRVASELARDRNGGTLQDTSFPKEMGKVEPNITPSAVTQAQRAS